MLAPTRTELDLTRLESVASYAQRPEIASIDVLVNNAGINRPARLEHTDSIDLLEHFNVNVGAAFMLVRSIGVTMGRRGGGRIVNVGSVYGSVGRPGRAMYSTTKAALDGLTRAAAVELGPLNVLVNSVCPGFVDTDLTRANNTVDQIEELLERVPLGRLATVSEIAEFIFYLGSASNTYITGQTVAIDGGFLCS